ncbi:MAG: hypothetical protein ABI811_08030 [Acidobacteriota bacterium]
MKIPKLYLPVLLFAAGLVSTANGQVQYRIDSFAGRAGIGDGGPATQALLATPAAIAPDSLGGFYIADTLHFRTRYVNAAGNISTVVDQATARPALGIFNYAVALALDSEGRLNFVDSASCVVVRREQNGSLKVIAGTVGVCSFGGDGGLATAASLNFPQGLAFAPNGALYVSDFSNNRIRKIDPTSGVITTVAGNGANTFGGEGVAAIGSTILRPAGIVVDSNNRIFVVETGYLRVRMIAANGLISTVAGTGISGNTGDGGAATSARFMSPAWIALDAGRNVLYVSDGVANRVRAIDLGGNTIGHKAGITFSSGITFATSFSGDGGAASSAGLANPAGLAVDPTGNLLIADTRNSRIRRVGINGTIQTVAGRWPSVVEGTLATTADLDNRGNNQSGNSLASDANGSLYIADRNLLTVRRVDKDGLITTVAGLPIDKTPANNSYGNTAGDGANAKLAKFGQLNAIALDTTGNLFIADGTSLRRVDSASGIINKIATLPGGTTGLRIDSVNRLAYLAADNQVLYRIDLNAASPTAQRIAGTIGTSGFSGDGELASSALLNFPQDVDIDSQGRVLIADFSNGRLRRISADGRISTIAGNGTSSPTGAALLTPANALAAGIGPQSLAIDPGGNIFLTEFLPVIRMLDAGTGQIRSIAGTGARGTAAEGIAASAATIDNIDSIAAGANGSIFILGEEDRVRILRPITVSSVQVNAGNGQSGAVNTLLPTAISVRVLSGQIALPGIPVEFKITSGSATFSASSALSDTSGIASTQVTMGAFTGPIVITATVTGLTPATFNLTATAAVNPNRPVLRLAATAGAYGGSTVIAPGSWVEIYGTNLSATSREWSGADFVGDQAPTTLDGVRVSIGGKAAFVWYISPGQLNVNIPDGIATGDALVVTTALGSSDPYPITVAARTPAILAPPTFLVGGVQYAAALFPDQVFVGRSNLIAGVAFRPAKPGDTITLYGVGLGATVPAHPAGKVVGISAILPNPVVTIGGANAAVSFAGLVTGAIGLYQFNVVVPNILPGDATLTVQVGGVPSLQNLKITVAN